MKRNTRVVAGVVVAVLVLFAGRSPVLAYSVLAHQAIIDAAWDEALQPLLLKKYPGSTVDQLREARAYTYGGCIIQDMGYYPLGSKLFTDLVHYVRSGEFIEALIDEPQNLNEYAFALGALAHYSADNNGHSIAVNRAVPIEYPKLRSRYGNVVTYADDPKAHIRVEFGMDVVQLARGNYKPDNYHDFIGFKVSKPVLERAFKKTYGLEMKDLFASIDLALGTYRHAVSGLIPEMTKVAWQTNKDEIQKQRPKIARAQFVYSMSRSQYEKEWGREYSKPGVMTRFLSFIVRILPKVGPLKPLAFKPPTAESERLFVASFDATLTEYKGRLHGMMNGPLRLENRDFDTGRSTRPGEYSLADRTYSKLVRQLAKDNFELVTPALREDILSFFSNPNLPIATKHRDEWRDTLEAVEKLRSITPQHASH